MAPTKIALCLLAMCAASTRAQQPAGADYIIRNFKFESGETLPELKLHYIALGKPRKDASGVVQPDEHDPSYGSYVINHPLPIEVFVDHPRG